MDVESCTSRMLELRIPDKTDLGSIHVSDQNVLLLDPINFIDQELIEDVHLPPLLQKSQLNKRLKRTATNVDDEVVEIFPTRQSDESSESALTCVSYSRNESKLLVAIHGPHDISENEVFSAMAIINTYVHLSPHLNRVPNFEDQKEDERPSEVEGYVVEQELSIFVSDCIQQVIAAFKYPKTQIDVCVHVLEMDYSIMSDILLAISYGLIASRIELLDILSAATMYTSNSIINVAMQSNMGQVCGLHYESIESNEKDDFDELLEKCKEQCSKNGLRIRGNVLRKF
ncbi:hypothetical protein ACOME3_007321 [Neoechinorhynchus agilis]